MMLRLSNSTVKKGNISICMHVMQNMSVSNMYSPAVTEEYVREQLWKKIFSNQQSGHPIPMSFKRAGKGSQ